MLAGSKNLVQHLKDLREVKKKIERGEEKGRNHIHLFPGVRLWSEATRKSMLKPASALQLNQCHRRGNGCCCCCCWLSCWGFFSAGTSWMPVNNHCRYCGWSGGEGARLKLLRTLQALKSMSGCPCVKIRLIRDQAAAVRVLVWFIYNFKYSFVSIHIYSVIIIFSRWSHKQQLNLWIFKLRLTYHIMHMRILWG